jgi:hypothetical protein
MVVERDYCLDDVVVGSVLLDFSEATQNPVRFAFRLLCEPHRYVQVKANRAVASQLVCSLARVPSRPSYYSTRVVISTACRLPPARFRCSHYYVLAYSEHSTCPIDDGLIQ